MNLLTDEINQAYLRGYTDGKATACPIHGTLFYNIVNGCLQCLRDAKGSQANPEANAK